MKREDGMMIALNWNSGGANEFRRMFIGILTLGAWSEDWRLVYIVLVNCQSAPTVGHAPPRGVVVLLLVYSMELKAVKNS